MLDPDGPRVRPPTVAGRFYPATAAELATAVDTLLDRVQVPADEGPAEAYVVPHAGYRFCGDTAAQAHARLRRHADQVRRVVLIGPAHGIELRGCAVPSTTAWTTPLGDVPIDVDAVRTLARDGHVRVDDDVHRDEHCLEMHLPFLQRALAADVTVLPIAVGASSVDDVVVTLAAAVLPGTVIICSTVLSHHVDHAMARAKDQRTVAAVVNLAVERIGVRDACGVHALRGLVAWARHQRLQAEVLDRRTSAQASGDTADVVGYAALALRRPRPGAEQKTGAGTQ